MGIGKIYNSRPNKKEYLPKEKKERFKKKVIRFKINSKGKHIYRKEYTSITIAAKENRVTESSISRALTGSFKSNGYYWKYVDGFTRKPKKYLKEMAETIINVFELEDKLIEDADKHNSK